MNCANCGKKFIPNGHYESSKDNSIKSFCSTTCYNLYFKKVDFGFADHNEDEEEFIWP